MTRRFDNGFMFSGFWVWSKALGINNDDFSAGVPNLTKDETKHLDYSLLNYDRPHNFVLNAIYQTKSYTDSKALGLAGQRLAGLGRLPLDERPAVCGRLLDSRHRRREPHRHRRQPQRAHRRDLRPGQRLQRRPVPAAQHGVLRAAAAGQRRRRIGAVLRAQPADQQPRHVALEELRRREDA